MRAEGPLLIIPRLSRQLCHTDLRTQVDQLARTAIRLPSSAPASTVENQPVTQIRPMITRKQFHQVPFDLHRIGFTRQAESPRKSTDVSVDDDALVHSKCIPQNDIRRLASHPGQCSQFLQSPGDLSRVSFQNLSRRTADRLGLVSVKSRRSDQRLNFVRRNGGEIFHLRAASKQRRSHEIHPDIGALRGENRRNQQLQRVGEVQLAVRIRINRRQTPGQNPSAFRTLQLSGTRCFQIPRDRSTCPVRSTAPALLERIPNSGNC